MIAMSNGTTDAARYERCPGLGGLEIVTARWHVHAFAPHMHDFYAVSLNDGGRGAFACRRALHDAAPGTCNLIAPGEVHTGHATAKDGWHYRNLYIERALMTALLEGIGWRRSPEARFAIPVVADPELASRVGRALAGLAAPASLLDRESRLLDVAARLATCHLEARHPLRPAGREPAAIARVRAWLDANSAREVSTRELARLAELSPHYLVRTFHRHVGIPPHRYQTVVRVLRARRLLRSGAPISEVAYRTGFCDQSHLSRCFKRVLGTTPGRYARRRE